MKKEKKDKKRIFVSVVCIFLVVALIFTMIVPFFM